MIDAVWTVGHHPSLCGTEKFGHLLAQKLGVPVRRIGRLQHQHPLVSVRASEVERWHEPPDTFELFLHDWWNVDGSIMPWLLKARRVYAANPSIARDIRPMRPDVIEAFAPSTIQGNPTRGSVNVLTFGMAHKLSAHTARYEKLKALLDDTPADYTVSVSTAIHEGSPWDETAHVAEHLRGIFGSHLRVLGYLADDALARELVECSAVAVFFEPALRANNTTFWAAFEAGRGIITNLDADSPREMEDANGVHDIGRLQKWPEFWPTYPVDIHPHDWDRLLVRLSAGQPCAK